MEGLDLGFRVLGVYEDDISILGNSMYYRLKGGVPPRSTKALGASGLGFRD